MPRPSNPFAVTRSGLPIDEYPIRGTVNPRIQYSQGFGEWEACVAAGLDLDKWENGLYAVDFKCRVLAWHRLHNLVQLHTADAIRPKDPPGSGKPRRRPPRRR